MVFAVMMVLAHKGHVMEEGVVGPFYMRFGLSSVDDQLDPVCWDVGESVDESLSAIKEQ